MLGLIHGKQLYNTEARNSGTLVPKVRYPTELTKIEIRAACLIDDELLQFLRLRESGDVKIVPNDTDPKLVIIRGSVKRPSHDAKR